MADIERLMAIWTYRYLLGTDVIPFEKRHVKSDPSVKCNDVFITIFGKSAFWVKF